MLIRLLATSVDVTPLYNNCNMHARMARCGLPKLPISNGGVSFVNGSGNCMCNFFSAGTFEERLQFLLGGLYKLTLYGDMLPPNAT